MDHVEKAGRLIAGTRRPVLSNRLVIVAHAATDWRMDEAADLAAIEFEHLSLADPEAVPAGTYAKAFLEQTSYGNDTLWDVLSPKVAPALDVRAALALVEADPAVIGIVYRTDARASGHVRILFEIPDSQAPPITYSAARVYRSDAPAAAERFFGFLFSRKARALFAQHGFVPFAQPGSVE
jgi:molybdate transport system substrate-binding protein